MRLFFCFMLVAGLAPRPADSGARPAWIDAERTIAVDQRRGIDPGVDYASLLDLGPWDDRNYLLTRDDLALLPADEARIGGPLPVFFRVALRRARPELQARKGVRYPMNALNVFHSGFGGYLVGGEFHRSVARRDGHLVVVTAPEPRRRSPAPDGLAGETILSGEPFESESAVAIRPADGTRLIAGTVLSAIEQKMYWSSDGGQTWTEALLPLEGACCDPSVAWSADGAQAYATTLGNCSVFGCELHFYRSDDLGVSWTGLENVTPGQPRRIPAAVADREVLHVDLSPASPWRERVYVVYGDGGVIKVLRSSDRGNSWKAASLSPASENLGVGADLVSGKDGTLHVAWPAYESRTIRLATSADGGVTFSAPSVVATTEASFSFAIPSQESREAHLYVSAATDLSDGPFSGALYLAWTDASAPTVFDASRNHALVRVARSHDGGTTWQVNSPHDLADAASVDRWQPALAVGDDGTVHVVFYDTRSSPGRTGVDVYYAFSTDGAASWSIPRRVTAETSPNIEHGFEFGDYGGLDIVLADLVATHADNRSETGEPGDSVDVYASGISPGPGGGGAGRIPGSLDVPGAPLTLSRHAGSADIDLDWDTVCGSGTDYEVYEGAIGSFEDKSAVLCSTGGATSATVTPAPGDRFWLVVASVGGSEGSYGRASDGSERPPAAAACRPQSIGACP